MPFAVFSNSALAFTEALATLAEGSFAERGRVGGISVAVGSEHRSLAVLPEALLPLAATLGVLEVDRHRREGPAPPALAKTATEAPLAETGLAGLSCDGWVPREASHPLSRDCLFYVLGKPC